MTPSKVYWASSGCREGGVCFNQPLDKLCVCSHPCGGRRWALQANGVTSAACLINLPSSQKINTKANIGSLVKWRMELSGRIAPVCVVFFKGLCHDAIRESQKKSRSISGRPGSMHERS